MSEYDDTVERRAITMWCRQRYHAGYPQPDVKEFFDLPASVRQEWIMLSQDIAADDDAAGYWLVPKVATEEMYEVYVTAQYGALETGKEPINAANAAGAVKEET